MSRLFDFEIVTAGENLLGQYIRASTVHVEVPRELALPRVREWLEHVLRPRLSNPGARVIVCVELGSDAAYTMGLHD